MYSKGNIVICLFLFFQIGLFNGVAQQTSQVLKINIKDYGAVGDGITNDYQAFLKAVNTINKNKGGEIFLPKGNYFIGEYNDGSTDYNKLTFIDNDGLKIYGNGAIISVQGAIDRKVTRKSKGKLFSKIFAIEPLRIIRCKNVIIEGLEINGNVNLMTRDKGVVESGKHLILIRDCENIRLKDLTLHHSQTDGLYIGGSSKIVFGTNIVSKNNARQGMSITGLIDGTFINCNFSNTGFTDGSYGHHGPSAGVDIEPNSKEILVENVTFKGCLFENNKGSQIVVSHPNTTKDIFFEECTIKVKEGNRRFALIVNAKNVTFNQCEFDLNDSNIYPIWHKSGSSSVFSNCEIKSNYSGIVAVNNKEGKSVCIDNCRFIYTGKTNKHFFPYIRMKEMEFINNEVIFTSEQYESRKVISLIENVRKVSGNVFYKNSEIIGKNKISFRGSYKEE